jgi:hypothetical protein
LADSAESAEAAAKIGRADVEDPSSAPTTVRTAPPTERPDSRRADVKYMLLIYGNEEIWSSMAGDFEQVIKETEALQKELRASGEFISAYGVAEQAQAKTVRIKDGLPVVSDGPYLEAKEYLGSIDLIECSSLERALEIAGRVPFARFGPVEVRPLTQGSESN